MEVCWSLEQQRKALAQRLPVSPVVHIQGNGDTTLCGIPYRPTWTFDIHQDGETANLCKRCERIQDKGKWQNGN
jgi:hypothetical protein